MTFSTATVKITTLHPDPANARKHSERNIDAIKTSLKNFGQRRPIVVHKDTVIAGNGTLEAARRLGWSEIVITETPDDWTIDQARAYAIADNRTAELAEWDKPILGDQLLELSQAGWDLPDLGFDPIVTPSNEDGDVDTSPQLGETKYAVIIDCANEWEQTELLERFSADGLHPRPLML